MAWTSPRRARWTSRSTPASKPGLISFAGPGKRDARAVRRDRRRASPSTANPKARSSGRLPIARQDGACAPRLAVRVNPDFEIKGSGMRMGGGAKPFGVDAARVPALVRRILASGADWRGFHIFAGSQALDADALIEAQARDRSRSPPSWPKRPARRRLWSISAAASASPISHGEQPLDVAAVGAALAAALAARPAILADSRLRDRARPLAGRRGGRLSDPDRRPEGQPRQDLPDHRRRHAAPARRSGNFGQVVRRNYPVAIADRFGAEPEEEVSIIGCLCTPLDRLADDVMMPRAEVGDLVAIFLAGAYGLSASPQAFLAQQPALEMLVGGRA